MEVADEVDVRIYHDRTRGYQNLANLALSRNELDVAKSELQQAIEGFEKLKQLRPQDLKSQQQLSTCYKMLGSIETRQKQFADAVASYDKSKSTAQRLADLNPQVVGFVSLLASIRSDLGKATRLSCLAKVKTEELELEGLQDCLDVAVTFYEQSIADYGRIEAEELVPLDRRNLALTHAGLADVYIDREEFKAAAVQLERARAVLAPGGESDGSDFAKREFGEIERVEKRLQDAQQIAY